MAAGDSDDERGDSDDCREVLIVDGLETSTASSSTHAETIRLALCSMTKRPDNIETWLRHHVVHAGVERFYLRVEDTQELEELLRRPPWDALVKAKFAYKSKANERNWNTQTARQERFVNDAIAWAKSCSVVLASGTWRS